MEFQFNPRLGLRPPTQGQESIEFLMNWTEPSPKAQFTPPGWRLIAQYAVSGAFGGTIVAMSVSTPSPYVHLGHKNA